MPLPFIASPLPPASPVPPGPRGGLPGRVLFAFRRGPLEFFQDLARRYGDVVGFKTFGTRFYFLNHPDLIRDVLVTHAERFEKGPVLKRARSTLGNGLLTSEGELHRRQRRLAQPAFHPGRVATYLPTMVKFAEDLGRRWERELTDSTVGGTGEATAGTAARDLHPDMMGLALRIAAEALFGADVEDQVRAVSRAMAISIEMSRRTMTFYGPWLMYLPLPSNFRLKRARRTLLETVGGFIRQRRAAEREAASEPATHPATGGASDTGTHAAPPAGGRNDLLSLLLRAVDTEGDQRGMTDELLRDEAITLFTAGHETTANALTFTWYLLATHPRVADRLAAEADAVVGPGERALTAEDLPRLAYARAVFAESMRLYPPAWAVARTAIEPLPVATPAGRWVIPKGGVVIMSQYVTHRDPRWWAEPEKFLPERWLEGAGAIEGAAEDNPRPRAGPPDDPRPPSHSGSHSGPQADRNAERPRYAYYPFGGGPRNCIGEAFAWMEGVVVLAVLGRRWRVELPPGAKPPLLQPTITLRPRDGMPLLLRRRGG